ncbi:hypothetical protein [Runella slithyformis]|uniref:hypothetical protein n=1 Tax=Runella slithyformis TaxID=106 RepID=UPI0002DECAC7|nr:hypothetical protein [Runella slithyformis]
MVFSPFAIGIDIEKFNPDFDTQPIVDSYFSDGVHALLLNGNYTLNFYTVRTRIETPVKAPGEGPCENMKPVTTLKDQVIRQ